MSFATDLAACSHTTLSSYAGVFFLAQEQPVTKTASTSTSVLVSSLTSLQHLFNISSTSQRAPINRILHLTLRFPQHVRRQRPIRHSFIQFIGRSRGQHNRGTLALHTHRHGEQDYLIQNPIMYHKFVSFLMHQIDNATGELRRRAAELGVRIENVNEEQRKRRIAAEARNSIVDELNDMDLGLGF